MKIWSVFSLVIVFHVAILGLLLIQPGCQSTPKEKPDPSMTAPTTAQPYSQPMESQQLDSSFNSGVTAMQSSGPRDMSSPTRPSGTTRTSPQTGLLEPVLEPVQDSLSLPPVTREYKVKKGDTLSGIARREGVSLNELLSANGLNRSSTIYVGQSLLVPSAAATSDDSVTADLQPSSKEVVVGKGDTLSSIAARTGTTVKTLKALNGLTSDIIYVGQRLSVPESASVPTPAPVRTPTQSVQAPVAGGSSYTVQPGDTPSGIARKFGISSAQLMAANNISDARKLYVGKVLVIPQGGTTQTSGTSRPATRSDPVTTTLKPVQSEPLPAEPAEDDPMSILEALEDEDLPFVEVEAVEEPSEPGN